MYTHLESQKSEMWFYKNLDVLRKLLEGRDDYDFLYKVENRTCTDDIYNLFFQKKDYIINAVKPIVALTKRAIRIRNRYGVSAEKEVKRIAQINLYEKKKK